MDLVRLVAIVRLEPLLHVRRVVGSRLRNRALRVHDVEARPLHGRCPEPRRVLARLVVVREQHHGRVLLTRLLAHVVVDTAVAVGHVRRIGGDDAAVVPEAPQGGGRVGRAAVGEVDTPTEVGDPLLGQVLTRGHRGDGRHDREDLLLRHEATRFRRGGRGVVLVVGELGELELEALDLVVVVETLEARLRPDGGVGEVGAGAETGGFDDFAVEAAHRGHAGGRPGRDGGGRQRGHQEHRSEAAQTTKPLSAHLGSPLPWLG